MSLALNQEQQMIQEAASQFLAEHYPVSELRRLRSLPTPQEVFNQDAWQHLVELGWCGALISNKLQGYELGLMSTGLIVIEMGKKLSVSPFISSSVIATTSLLQCIASVERNELLEQIATGNRFAIFAHNEQVSCQHDLPIVTHVTYGDDGILLCGSKLCIDNGSFADTLLVTAINSATQQLELLAIDLNKETIPRTTRRLIDHHNYIDIHFENVLIDNKHIFHLPWQQSSEQALSNIYDVGCMMNAAELLGISLQAFTMTIEYLSQREQFGQPIGAFQALQHRVSHAFTQLELLKSVLYQALDDYDNQAETLSLSASHAKALANDCTRLITSEAIQMHGGIGLTDELDIGLFYKRARVLQTQYGSSHIHRQRFARLSGY